MGATRDRGQSAQHPPVSWICAVLLIFYGTAAWGVDREICAGLDGATVQGRSACVERIEAALNDLSAHEQDDFDDALHAEVTTIAPYDVAVFKTLLMAWRQFSDAVAGHVSHGD